MPGIAGRVDNRHPARVVKEDVVRYVEDTMR
jgi:hypothetical protein